MTSGSSGKTSLGGSAATSGEVFRADVATRIAIHLLAQAPLWGQSPIDAVPLAVRCEAATKVDDIAVTTSTGRILIQAKGHDKLNIPPNATLLRSDDPFVKAISQLVEQQKTSDPLDADKDRFVLAYKDGTEEVRRLKKIAERVGRLDVSTDEPQGRVEVLRTEEERDTFTRFELVIQHVVGTTPSWEQLISLLRLALFWPLPESVTHRIEIDPGNLMRSVLAQGESCEGAIDALSREIISLAAIATGTDMTSLRQHLGRSFRLEAIADCSRDIERVRSTSGTHIEAMRRWQRPAFGESVDRGVVAELVAAMNDGPVVVVGDRGVGKSALALAIADSLSGSMQQVVVCDLKQSRAELFTMPGDPPLANGLDRVLAAFPHPLPASVVLDGLEEIAGQRDLEKVIISLVERVRRASDQWKLIAFARPSTLRGRRELQELFKGVPLSSARADFKSLRHLGLGPLDDKQLDHILTKAPNDIRELASDPAVREFLSIPETLAMLADVAVQGTAPAMYLSALLEQYWTTHVTDLRREAALIAIAHEQRRSGSSTVNVVDVVAKGASPETLQSLHEDRVLVIAAGRVGFAHDMLADFVHARSPDV